MRITIDGETRRCVVCGRVLPQRLFRYKGGTCRLCMADSMSRISFAPQDITHKVCGRCHRDLPISEFTRDKHKKDGYNYACKTCVKEHKR